jgi:hypothetical protein
LLPQPTWWSLHSSRQGKTYDIVSIDVAGLQCQHVLQELKVCKPGLPALIAREAGAFPALKGLAVTAEQWRLTAFYGSSCLISAASLAFVPRNNNCSRWITAIQSKQRTGPTKRTRDAWKQCNRAAVQAQGLF